MVSRAYLLHKPAPPSPAAVFLHRSVLPPVIDAVASVERVVEKAAARTRRAPVSTLTIAFGAGVLLTALLRG